MLRGPQATSNCLSFLAATAYENQNVCWGGLKTDLRLRRRACAAEFGDEKWDVLSLLRSYGTADGHFRYLAQPEQAYLPVWGRTVGQPSEPTTVVERRVMRIKPKRLNASGQLTPQISSAIIPFASIPCLCVMPVISNHADLLPV